MLSKRPFRTITAAVVTALLLAGCASSPDLGVETAASEEEPHGLADDAGTMWQRVDIDFLDESRIDSIAVGAGRLWAAVFVEQSPPDGGWQLWSSSDAVTWQQEDLLVAGLPPLVQCSASESGTCLRGSVTISGDDDSFVFARFVDESVLDALGIPFEPRVMGAEWVLRYDGEGWSSFSPQTNGLLARDAPPGFWDPTAGAHHSATHKGTTVMVARGAWFEPWRTTHDAFHARLIDESGRGAVIHGMREPFTAEPFDTRDHRLADVVVHTGDEWMAVGRVQYFGLDSATYSLGVWTSADGRDWGLRTLPVPEGGRLLPVEAIAVGDPGIVVSGRLEPALTPEAPGNYLAATAIVMFSTDGMRSYEAIPLKVDGVDTPMAPAHVSWVGDRFVAASGNARGQHLWQSFDGLEWTLVERTLDRPAPSTEVLRWGSGLVARTNTLIIVSGIDESSDGAQ